MAACSTLPRRPCCAQQRGVSRRVTAAVAGPGGPTADAAASCSYQQQPLTLSARGGQLPGRARTPALGQNQDVPPLRPQRHVVIGASRAEATATATATSAHVQQQPNPNPIPNPAASSKHERASSVTLTPSRRVALTAAGAASVLALDLLCGASPAWSSLGALPKTCDLAAAGGALLSYTDVSGRFKLLRPCGWKQVPGLGEDDGAILASFYNPEVPGAETLAVYLARSPAQDTRDLGSPQGVAEALATAAPNGQLFEAYSVDDEAGRRYYIAHVQFGGNTAGTFGAVREFRSVVVDGGLQYTLRVTTTRIRYLEYEQLRQLMKAAVESFRLSRRPAGVGAGAGPCTVAQPLEC